MWPPLEWLLAGWTLLAAGWWIVAIILVRRVRQASAVLPAEPAGLSVSIFKPIPGGACSPQLIAALESFVSQLDEHTEMLLGIEEADAAQWQPVLAKWARPQVKPVIVPRPAQFLSPKVSWFHTLAKHAQGELWLWSDADIVAPAGSVNALRRELTVGGAGMVTCPYVVRSAGQLPMMLEALFVNVEFYPGVLFCRQTGPVQFGLGAGMMFSAERFRERAHWEKLGARMADDNALGRALAPVRISETTFATLAAESSWRDALQHYLRWQKTIRWCRPAGFAGQIMILPVLGWLAATLTHPGNAVAWLGLALTVQIETLAAVMLFRLIGCEMRAWWVAGLWSAVLRPLAWLWCWLPRPIVFRSQRRMWWSLYRSVPLEGET